MNLTKRTKDISLKALRFSLRGNCIHEIYSLKMSRPLEFIDVRLIEIGEIV